MSVNSLKAMSYFRLPPDGAGKELFANMYWQVQYSNATYDFVVGDIVSGQTSLSEGEVINVNPTDATTGYISLIPQDATGTGFTVGETIVHASVGVAIVVAVTVRYIQDFIQVGKNNPRFGQHIDKDGAAFVRFTEGAQQLDAYGQSRMATPDVFQCFDFKYGLETESFFSQSAGSTTITHLSYEHAVAIDVDAVSGSYGRYISAIRPLVYPGTSLTFMISVAVGDTGKAGVVRRWGAFSNSNGYFFELSGTQLSLVKRSNSTGAVINTKIAQADWNDPLLANDSNDGIVLDVSKVNTYWFNIQTLTAGAVRFGCFNEQGDRITIHEIVGSNSYTVPGLRNSSLALRVEEVNEAASASPSRLKLFGCEARSEGTRPEDEVILGVANAFSLPAPITISGSGTYPLLSFRSANTFNGVDNYKLSVPVSLSILTSGSAVILSIVKNATLNTSSFAVLTSRSPVMGDMTATSASGGYVISSNIYDVGVTQRTFDKEVWSARGECMTSLGGSGLWDYYTVMGQKADTSAGNVKVQVSFNWVDYG